MTAEMNIPKKRRWLRWLVRLAAAVLLFALALTVIVWTGLADRWMRNAIVGQLERVTGGRVELKAFRFHVWSLRAELDDLTIHGLEPEGSPPLFHADHLLVDMRLVSLLRRKVALDKVQLDHPAVHVRFTPDGRSNFPGPKTGPRPPGIPWSERIFDLAIGELQLNDGELLFNDTRIPLAAQGGTFECKLDHNSSGQGLAWYEGEFHWERMVLVARRYLPFTSDVQVKFRLERDAFELTEFRWKLPHSDLRAGARLANFTDPAWDFHYQGQLSLEDLRKILRKPHSPGGRVEFLGEGTYAQGNLAIRGRYVARDIEMPYDWFHTSGMQSRGSYQVENRKVEIPDFRAQVLGGEIQGRVTMDFDGFRWRAETHAQGMDLGEILRAVDHEDFPIGALHWGGRAELDAETTWARDFQQLESRGVMRWSPEGARENEIPATARLDYHYVVERKFAELRDSFIATPSSRIEFVGPLGADSSSLSANISIDDLAPWNEFINRLRGRDVAPVPVAGRARWQGRVLGDIVRPTFSGHIRGEQVTYDALYWDEIEGNLTYSPEQFRFEQAQARRRGSSATLNVWLELDDWSFRPESRWTLEASVTRADTDELQALFGASYPARGLLSGTFSGHGTRSEPELTGTFELAEGQAWGYPVEHVRARLGVRRDEIRVSDADVRVLSGRVSGNLLYRPEAPGREGAVEFDVAGSDLPIESLPRLQNSRIPVAGRLSFAIQGRGPLRAPMSEGTFRLADLHVGGDLLGSFEGKLHSDGRQVGMKVTSAMSTGHLDGELSLTLAGDYPLQGQVTVKEIDLDAFIQAALRLKELTGHSSVDGTFRITGALRKPETITVDADISRIKFDYQYLKLENVGPVQLTSSREELRIRQAHIRGPDTDFVISGRAGFTRTRSLDLSLAGTVNLQLLEGFLPELNARGAAQVNAKAEGTMSSPRITGRIHVENVAANYGEFPAGLSKVSGDLVFDSTRLVFENVTAEAGGGTLSLGGSLSYGDGPVRYDLTARALHTRIRYPEGMSWLASGTLRLSGTTRGGLLSGRVAIERLLMSENFDLATFIVASREGPRGPATTSPFLRNLQFDIEATSSPDARVEWSSARFECEASLRVRGTWEHPILLGHIHLLNGEMMFRGNRYRLTRGDINFSNPFRLVPVLNIEAVTTIRQYEITLNFSGPADKLHLAYRADPPLPATDIIALLALGRTGEESELRSPTAVQSPELGATTLLSEAISSQVGGRVERLFGISRFRVDPFLAGTGSEQNSSARITVEQQITRHLTITYVTNVTSTQQQIIQIEYAVNRDVSLIFLRDQNGTFGLDVKFKKRFR